MIEKNMRFLIGVMMFVMSFPCLATDTLDCIGKPYGIMIHVGYKENGEDFLADILLYEEGHKDPVAVYGNKDIDVVLFKWRDGEFENMMKISSRPDSEIPLKITASNGKGTIKVYEKEFAIECLWER